MSPSATTNMTSLLYRIGIWLSMIEILIIAILNLTEFDSSIKISTVKPRTWTTHSSFNSSFLSTDSSTRTPSTLPWCPHLIHREQQEPAVTITSVLFFPRRKLTLLSKTPTVLSKHRLARIFAGAFFYTTPICLPWSRPAQFLSGASIDFYTSLSHIPPARSSFFPSNLSDSIKARCPFHTSSSFEHQVFPFSS